MERSYNKDLRSTILICSIRVEEAASIALKLLFRTIKPDSKTLGNKSSSLSLKNKIDLLYDLEDISKNDYSNMIKFMEILNQFIHNANCNNFMDLYREFPEGLKYLESNYPNEEDNKELMYQMSFFNLWKTVLGKLLVMRIEYNKGAEEEMKRYVESESLRKSEDIYNSILNNWKVKFAEKNNVPFLGYTADDVENQIISFYNQFQFELINEQLKILESIGENKVSKQDIYKRKVGIMEKITSQLKKE